MSSRLTNLIVGNTPVNVLSDMKRILESKDEDLDSFLSIIDIAQKKNIEKINKNVDNLKKGDQKVTNNVLQNQRDFLETENSKEELQDTIKMLEIKLKRIKKTEYDEKINLSELISSVEKDLKKGTDLLDSILEAQSKLDSESEKKELHELSLTKDLYERSLAKQMKHYGREGASTAVAYANLGNFYYELAAARQSAETRKELLRLSKANYKEALRILTKIFGPDHVRTAEVSSILAIISRKLSVD